MNRNGYIDVLIIGAGPTGLMMACQLARLGINFRIVEKNKEPTTQSRALAIHAGSISIYHSHHRYVSQFKIGRCFLAGDAAHIHSPVGAQGMNTGLQDAFNLAWKLAFVVKKQANENLLSSYQDERLPFARQLVRSTDRAFGITVSQSPLIKYIRMHVAPRILAILLKIKFMEHFLFRNISQIGITYPDSMLSHRVSTDGFSSRAPRPGERLPYLEFEGTEGERVNIQQRVTGLSFYLFIFSGTSKHVPAELFTLLKQHEGIINFENIPFIPGTQKLYGSLGVKATGVYLIRPDLYIGYHSVGFDINGLKSYLQLFLTS